MTCLDGKVRQHVASLNKSLTSPTENTLKALFGVSGVSLCERTVNEVAPTWQYKETMELDGKLVYLKICQSNAIDFCPRDGD